MIAVPKKIGFDFIALGWKMKDDTFRFEWNPMISFVFFNWQAVVTFYSDYDDHYFECWLAYRHKTDRSKSVKERIEEAKKFDPCKWISFKNDERVPYCGWDLVLKEKYLK